METRSGKGGMLLLLLLRLLVGGEVAQSRMEMAEVQR